MSYLNRPMSPNARKAYERGMFCLSDVDVKFLESRRFTYSVEFFYWLCDEHYLRSSERHHTTEKYRLTEFYHPKCVDFANLCLDLDSLYTIYQSRETVDTVAYKKGISFSRVMMDGSLLGLKTRPITLDCVAYENLLFWSTQTVVFCTGSDCKVISRWDNYPEDWQNPNTADIIRMIASRKKPTWSQSLGNTENYQVQDYQK